MNEETISAEQIRANYQSVLERINSAAESSGRDPVNIKLVAVSKEKPISVIQAAIEAGICIFGENYAEDALPKIQALYGSPDIQWHMIGHVQSRKARLVIENFDYMHSLDSVKLAQRLDRYAQYNEKVFPVLIEFNLSGEASKFGFSAWEEDNWKDLLPSIEQILGLPNLQVDGLMTVTPYSDDTEQSRPYYKSLCRLQDFLRAHFPQVSWSELSMGMSADYDIAVEEGATWVRVGQAILGHRD